MKAWEVQESFGLDSLKLVEQARAQAGTRQVLLKMRAWSLNYRDLMVVKGQYNPKLRFPFTPLSDGVGEVAAVGDGVSAGQGRRPRRRLLHAALARRRADRREGEIGPRRRQRRHAGRARRAARGRRRQRAGASERRGGGDAAVRRRRRPGMPLVAAGELKAGDTVLVQGTGGVSLFALQFARLHGARVIATSSSDEKLTRVLRAGRLRRHQLQGRRPSGSDKVRELTGGVGVDHVVEVGGAGTLGQSLKAVRTGGTISLIGVLSGAGQVNPLPILMKNVRVQGILRRQPRDVRGDEPGDRLAQAEAGRRSRLSVRRGARGDAAHGGGGPFRQGVHRPLTV